MFRINIRVGICFSAFCCSIALAQTSVKETRKLLGEWVEAEKLISEESTSWKTEKATLQDLSAALLAEIKQLDANLAKSDEEAAGVSNQRRQLNERRIAAEDAAKSVGAGLTQLERELKLALDSFPTPLLNRLSSFREKLFDAERQKAMTLRDRLETCTAILQSAQIFHKSVNLERQEFSLDDGQSREFHVLYFGMSIAYFVNDSGTVAGYGAPAKKGWQWIRKDGLADEIRRGVAIRNKRALPAFLRLPIPVREQKSPKDKE